MHALLIDFNFFAYTVALANALAEQSQVTMLLPHHSADHFRAKTDRRVNFQTFYMPRLRSPRCTLMVRSLFKTIKRAKPDVVHQLSWHLWFNMALPFFPHVPLVTTIHDAVQHPGDKASPPLFHRWQWQYANQVIVHTESIKQQMLQLDSTLDHKLHIVPHGAYDFYKAWAQTEPDTQKQPTILFFGRIWAYKGLQYLIEAEPMITSQIPNARIVIAGYGESFDKYEQMMVNKEHFIVHNYRIPDEMVASLFQQASVVALPYTEASQSGVLAIAYAFGKPVVASAVGGIPEVVQPGQTGLLVPPGDSPRLAEAIITLLQNPILRLEMGQRALAKANAELSWPSVAGKTLEVYKKAVQV